MLVVLRRYFLIYIIVISCICIVLLWHFATLETPLNSTKLQALCSMNLLLQSSHKKSNATIPNPAIPDPGSPNAGSPNQATHNPATPNPNSANRVPATSALLPNLTLDAQDSFYGFGCHENRYRKRLQKILGEWERLAKHKKITDYFICFGSLLGSVRNGDMVPYDSDMDLCMFRHDYYKLDPEESKRPLDLNDGKIHLLLQRHSPNPWSDTPRKDCKGNIVREAIDDCSILDPPGRLYNGQLVYMDIFMFEDLGTKLWDEYKDKMHDRDAVLPVKPCKYLGLDTKCPNNTGKYLNVYYGKDYMAPHHVCKAGKWVQHMADARPAFV